MTKANDTDGLRERIRALTDSETDTAVLKLVLRILELAAGEGANGHANT